MQSHLVHILHVAGPIFPLLLGDTLSYTVCTLYCDIGEPPTSLGTIPAMLRSFALCDRLPTSLARTLHTSMRALLSVSLVWLLDGFLFGSSFPPLFSFHSTISCQAKFTVLEKNSNNAVSSMFKSEMTATLHYLIYIMGLSFDEASSFCYAGRYRKL